MPFKAKRLAPLSEVIHIKAFVHPDDRGWFVETYKKSDFETMGISSEFVQDNRVRSSLRGTLRGLHFQKEPAAQGKLVCCVTGEVFDVAVDIRKESPTYGKWVSAQLSAANHTMIWVPAGFAHGVMTLSDATEIVYKVTSEYSPTHERSVRWDDRAIGIQWPMANPILSKKDAEAPLLSEVDNNFVWSL